MNLHPLGDYVLLRLVEVQEKTAGGIILPDTAQEQPAEGWVEALASDVSDELSIGDRVIYKRFAGEEILLDGVKHRLVPSGDLLAKYVQADAIPE